MKFSSFDTFQYSDDEVDRFAQGSNEVNEEIQTQDDLDLESDLQEDDVNRSNQTPPLENKPGMSAKEPESVENITSQGNDEVIDIDLEEYKETVISKDERTIPPVQSDIPDKIEDENEIENSVSHLPPEQFENEYKDFTDQEEKSLDISESENDILPKPSSVYEYKKDPNETNNNVVKISKEQLEREYQEYLERNRSSNGNRDWLIRPEKWPAFIKFPSNSQNMRISELESRYPDGNLPQEIKDNINEKLQEYSEDMVSRSKDIHEYICAYNEKYFNTVPKNNIFSRMLQKSTAPERHDFNEVQRKLQQLEKIQNEKDPTRIAENTYFTSIVPDPFNDIKWAILLDPNKPSDDPLFKKVARWGHGVAVTHDGGRLKADDKSIFVPMYCLGTKQAGALAVYEAFERGWETIDIQGTIEFIEGAREVMTQLGIGGKLVTQSGLLGRKTDFLMPNPPVFNKAVKDSENARPTNDELMTDKGKAPENSPEEPLDDDQLIDNSEFSIPEYKGKPLAKPSVDVKTKKIDINDGDLDDVPENHGALSSNEELPLDDNDQFIDGLELSIPENLANTSEKKSEQPKDNFEPS